MMPMVDGVPGSVTKSGNVVNPVFSQDHKILTLFKNPELRSSGHQRSFKFFFSYRPSLDQAI